MAGRLLRVALAGAEREQVGKLLGTTWALSGRQVGAKMLATAIESLGADLDALLTETGGPLRNRPAERAVAQRNAEIERALAASALAARGHSLRGG